MIFFFSCRKFFTARVYAKLLHNDPYGRISIMQFFNYVMRKGVELVFTFNYLHLPDWTSCHWSVFTSALPSSLAASDSHRSEPVWCSRTGLPQRVGQLHTFFFYLEGNYGLLFSWDSRLTVVPWCRIWRTTSWSWSPLCLSSMDWRSPSTLFTSAPPFASSFSS